MGNTSSNPTSPHARVDSPARTVSSPRGSPSPASASRRVHHSLRYKKKSLELPDLASLTLTPAASPASVSPHPAHRRPRASSPIPIPTPANPPQQTFRVQHNLASGARLNRMGDGSRYRSSLSAFNSTRSLLSAIQDSPPRSDVAPIRPEFVPEVIYSTIPLALEVKPQDEDRKPDHVNTKIAWKEGGKKVVLIRAGHDNWQGRQPMEYDSQTNSWYTIVPLRPGTHHFKFIVDDQIRLTNDYQRAVDDMDGTLANYVAVAAPTAPSSPNQGQLVTPLASPNHAHPNQFNSFWSDSTAAGGTGGKGKEAEWTSEIPSQLTAAAAEEETYLASADSPTSSASGVPTPNIPPAPALPRHLDKLILNVRPPTMPPSAAAANGDRDRRRSGRQRRERERKENRQQTIGMTAAELAEQDGIGVQLPVVTAGGTEVAPGTPVPPSSIQNRPWDGPGISDDASVLPVPSHVVLHHLSTSAIRNGVLAVANTTRYRKKRHCYQYITTVYYKPT
ncbi:5'-AMP-activated protein kinase beta subunit, interation domain-containing protein [Epithele typhae]|uniref:5'-AMP-activated protein kinase beta subunit, interation domain-containing protein n=1 Tax=Epithele typhae TaxID=378194 RepID=UPI0020086479|nr:5'-AMP-activated protein kinase beta subunit, interation domain-containing protein [Epithele typhae]KAH9931650.1 5'-AMP-activated protein kinase beta subunit, interation domain-containing protein [Epithele typhae]